MSESESNSALEELTAPDFIDLERGEAYIIGGVDEALMAAFRIVLKAFRKTAHKEIKIFLSTEGGSAACGLGIYDMLTAYEKDVCIVASGYCYSAGVIIMQAAKRRAATQHTTILIHYGSLDIEGTLTPKDINELHQQTKMIDSFNHKILKTRWKGDSTALHNLLSKDVLLTAKQAKDYGLIDEVV